VLLPQGKTLGRPIGPPRLLQGRHPLRTPADLRFHTLLHDDFRLDWRIWLLAAGVKDVDPERGPAFTDSSMVVQAAVEGQGVALARSVLAAADLAAGRLVKPFDVSMPARWAYYAVCPRARRGDRRIKAFRDWLLAEAEQTKRAAPI
jgi:LysR family glycine cleavage system transcriptional activator